MTISRDPCREPELPAEMVIAAREANLQIVLVYLADLTEVIDGGTLQFVSLTAFIPRSGEFLMTENGQRCRVVGVEYQAAKHKGFPLLVPTVYAEPAEARWRPIGDE